MLTGSLGNEKSKKAKMDVMQVAMGASVMSRHKAFMEKSPFVISPRTWYMRRWDLVTLLLLLFTCLLYTSPSPRDMRRSRMPSSA